MADYFHGRRFTTQDVPGFDPDWYLGHNPDVLSNFQSWSQDDTSVDWRDYVRANPDLDAAYNRGIGIHPEGLGGAFIRGPVSGPDKPSRWEWGHHHWSAHGKAENLRGKQRILPKIVGGRISPSVTRNIWTGPSMSTEDNKRSFAAWHYDRFGQYETGRGPGAFKSESAFWHSPGETQKRQDKFNQQLLDQQAKFQADQIAIQEEMARKAARVKGRSPTGVGGAASIKGSRLSITEAGGRKGTKRFARPTEFMNTLGIGSATPSTGKSTLNL